MTRSIPWFWIALAALLLLLPGPAGRILLDLLGGLTLTLLLLPLLAGGAAWIGWQILKRRLRTCAFCGFTSLGTEVCPACGQAFSATEASDAAEAPSRFAGQEREIDASQVTITVDAVDVEEREG